MMKKLTGGFLNLKLAQKFTLIIFLIVYIPVLVLTSVLLRNTQDTLIRERINGVRLDIEQLSTRVQKTAEIATVFTQTFATNAKLLSYLEQVHGDGEAGIHDSLSFYRNDIATLSKITYANAYLYQIRVYADSMHMPEMMPVLYRMSRMARMSWADQAQGRTGWYFDYADDLFPDYVSPRKAHLMGYISPLYSADGVYLGMIEAAFDMETLMPGLFAATEETFLCLIDDAGRLYYDRREGNPWADRVGTLAALAGEGDDGPRQTRLGQEEVIVSCVPLVGLNARLAVVNSLSHEVSMMSRQRAIFYTAMLLGMVLLIALIRLTVKVLLRRFYGISDSIRAIQQGDLSLRVPQGGQDEVAEMGVQINQMLDTIEVLMAENTKREVIMKNTEIRALHNQINAHFIYNVLESIKMMAEVNEHFQIADAVTSLGKLLRYSMRWTSRNVTIEEEVEYIQNYLSLTNLRFDHQIRLSLSIPDALWQQAIPKISLQPIVENAIGHGLGEVAEDAYIYIKAYAQGGRCIIEITDPGKGIDQATLRLLEQKIAGAVEDSGGSGHGIGLKNVQDRIRVTFGEAYGLTIQSQVSMYTKVVVTLPLTGIGGE